MSDGVNVRPIICLCLASIVASFSAGCANKQRAVELYVDAVMLAETSDNEAAIKKLNSAVQTKKDFSLAYSLLGELYQKIRDYEKSAASYEKVTQLNPWSFKDFFNLGKVYQIMKKFVEAARAFARACELRPDHLEAHINAAKSYYKIEDYNNALVYGEQAQQIDSNVIEIPKLLGDIYESQKDHEQAIRSYKRALEIDSNNPEIMTSLAVAYLRTDRPAIAKELLTSVVQIQPDNNSAYRHLGYCHLLSYYQANDAYKREMETNRDDVELLDSLKEQIDKSVTKSIESYTKAVEINVKDWEAHKGLGVAYAIMATNKADETLKTKAVEQWELSLELKPDQAHRERLLKYIRRYSQ